MSEGFIDHQCGIVTAPTAGHRCDGTDRRARGRDRAVSGITCRIRDRTGFAKPLLFDQLQQRALALVRRFWIVRPLRRRGIRHHRITQSLQFRVCNSIEFHAKFKNCHGHQLRGLPAAAVDKRRPALLEGGQDRLQSFFRISHQRFFRHRAYEVRWKQSSRWFHKPLHKARISSKRRGGFHRPGYHPAHGWPTHRTNK